MYEMRLDCNKWNWTSDGDQHHLEFEMEYTVLKHPQSDAINAVAVEVYRVDFNWQESSLKGKGVRIYKRSEAGPPVHMLIGLTPMLELKFSDELVIGCTAETQKAFELTRDLTPTKNLSAQDAEDCITLHVKQPSG